jgi:predicted aspartyl protease
MEDILEGEQVLAGTFYLNGHPILILFDSGATQDFISKVCTQKYQMTIESIKTPYMIRTPGGNVLTKQVVMNALLNLAGKVYKTHLIVLDGQGIDVILGMSWMKERRVLLDIASRTVQLRSPKHVVVVILLPSPSLTNPLLHHYLAFSFHT